MSETFFRVECAAFIKISGRWSVRGRAYADVSVGDMLVTSPDADQVFRVEQIMSYGRSTDLLSQMMTGTLILSGGDESFSFPAGSSLYKQDAH
jgi:hypothetical protein